MLRSYFRNWCKTVGVCVFVLLFGCCVCVLEMMCDVYLCLSLCGYFLGLMRDGGCIYRCILVWLLCLSFGSDRWWDVRMSHHIRVSPAHCTMSYSRSLLYNTSKVYSSCALSAFNVLISSLLYIENVYQHYVSKILHGPLPYAWGIHIGVSMPIHQ